MEKVDSGSRNSHSSAEILDLAIMAFCPQPNIHLCPTCKWQMLTSTEAAPNAATAAAAVDAAGSSGTEIDHFISCGDAEVDAGRLELALEWYETTNFLP
jgi:hypothetical protein